MVHGLTVRGKVTDKATGRLIAGARVEYYPVYYNASAEKLVAGVWGPQSRATTGPDGSYAVTVLPGPGQIGVTGPQPEAYMPAWVTPQEIKDFFKGNTLQGFQGLTHGTLNQAGGNNTMIRPLGKADYNSLVLLEPGEKEDALVRDVALERPQERQGQVVGPDGQPLTGVTVGGLTRRPWEEKTLKGAEFTVRDLNPKAPRSLRFRHKDKNLGLFLGYVPAEKDGPLVAKLQPCGSLSGRILDQDGQPLPGVRLDIGATTDNEGRFRVEGLIAGKYDVRQGPQVPYAWGVVVEPGKHKDLGDLKQDK
jgi:protocatechuate 3,4-dioxygenase beta subunit